MKLIVILVELIAVIMLLRYFWQHQYWQGINTAILKQCKNMRYFLMIMFIYEMFIIFYLDLPVALQMRSWHLKYVNSWFTQNAVWHYINLIADSRIIAGMLLCIIVISYIMHNARLRYIAIISIASMLYAGILNAVLKLLINRQRPLVVLDPLQLFHLWRSVAWQKMSHLIYANASMPSGHTISMTAALLPFFLGYQWISLRIILLSWILFTAFARVYTLNHWLSDVILAFLLGYIVSSNMYAINKDRLCL